MFKTSIYHVRKSGGLRHTFATLYYSNRAFITATALPRQQHHTLHVPIRCITTAPGMYQPKLNIYILDKYLNALAMSKPPQLTFDIDAFG